MQNDDDKGVLLEDDKGTLMEEDEGSDSSAAGSRSLTDSPYVGGNKMSSSLKDKLKRIRKYSSPISRPFSTVSAKSIQLEMSAHEYSQEEIVNAMNEPEINESACSNTEEIVLMDEDKCNEKDDYENGVDTSGADDISADQEYDSSFTKESFDNIEDESYSEINTNSSCCSKNEIDNYIDEPVIELDKDVCAYSKEDIENCVDRDSVLEIFRDLQKEYVDNEEKLRKLKLVKKHHTMNTPAALKSLNEKWVTCTQLALRKLYDFMPEPRSITFETFLNFLDVDFDAVKYNPETDSFA